MAFPDDYGFYDKLVITSGDISSGPHSNFPVYVDLSEMSTQFWSNVRTDGGDIRVTVGDGLTATQLPVHVVEIDTVGETGRIVFKAGTLSTTARTFSIWYNGTDTLPAVTSTYGRNNVWTDYVGVWPLNEAPDASAPQFVDATGGGNDGTSNGSMDTNASAPIGTGVHFDGTDDWIDCGADASLRPTPPDGSQGGGWSFWTRRTGTLGEFRSRLIHWLASDTVCNMTDDGDTFQAFVDTDANSEEVVATANPTIAVNTWYFVQVYLDGTDMVLYVDGTSRGTNNLAAEILDFLPVTDRVNFGADYNAGGTLRWFHLGDICDVRLRIPSTTAGWAATEYNNQSDFAGFSTITAEGSAPSSGLAGSRIVGNGILP